MSLSDKHYNAAVAARLRTIVDMRQWSLLLTYLNGLSNAQFRTAGYLLGEKFMPLLGDGEFWTLAKILVESNTRAFLVTVLKSWCSTRNVTTTIDIVEFREFLDSIKGRSEDVRKCMMIALPKLSRPDYIIQLMRMVGVDDPRERLGALIQCTTQASSFVLLNTLRELEDERSLLIRATHYIMKRGDGLSFNLASLLCAYFGLDEVKGIFSLRIRPYELSRLCSDYDSFCKVVL